MDVVIFPGSFDPFTNGHKDIVRRASEFSRTVVIAVMSNSGKEELRTIDQRIEIIKTYDLPKNVRIVSGVGKTTAQVAIENDAQAIVKGVRDTKDFEYEKTQALINLDILGLETIFLTTNSYISSSLVRELIKYRMDQWRGLVDLGSINLIEKYYD